MMKFKDEMNVLLLSDVKMTQQELSGKNHVIVEGIVSQQSSLIGKTLKEFNESKVANQNSQNALKTKKRDSVNTELRFEKISPTKIKKDNPK